MSASWCE